MTFLWIFATGAQGAAPLLMGRPSRTHEPLPAIAVQNNLKFPESADLSSSTFERFVDLLLREAAYDHGDSFYPKQIQLRLDPKRKKGVMGVVSLNLFGEVSKASSPSTGELWVAYEYSDQNGYQKDASNYEKDILWSGLRERDRGGNFFAPADGPYQIQKTFKDIFEAVVKSEGSSFDELIVTLRLDARTTALVWDFEEDRSSSVMFGASAKTGSLWDASGEFFDFEKSGHDFLPGLQLPPHVGPVRPQLP